MRKFWIILFILLVIVAVTLIVFVFMKKKKVEVNSLNIKFMHFSYSTSTMMNGNVIYEINYKDDKYIASIKPNNKSEEEKLEIELSKDNLEKIVNVLDEYDVASWNKFSKRDQNVLDGNGFSFSLRTQDGKEIVASGYMKWPTNYGKVQGELDHIFTEIYEANYIEDLTYLYLSYSNGYEANSNTNYRIKKDNDKYSLTVKLYGEADEDEKEYEVDSEFIKKVELILNKYGVSTWDGFRESDKDVLDGDSFSFNVNYKDKKISASGYELWPNNFGNVKNELKELIKGIN